MCLPISTSAPNAPNVYIEMRKTALTKSFKRIALLALLAMVLASAVPAKAATNDQDDNSPKLSIRYLSPYITANNSLLVEIATDAPAESTVNVDVFTKTNTRSQLTAFGDNLGKGRVRDSTSILLNSAQITESSYRFEIPINSDSNAGLNFRETGVYPIAISLTTPKKDTSETAYSFTTYIPTVSESGSAYSQKLNVVPLLIFDPLIDRRSLIKNDKNAKELIESYSTQFTNVSNTVAEIANLGAQSTLILSPEALESASLLATLSSDDAIAELFSVNQPSNIEYVQDTYVPLNIAELEEINKSNLFSNHIALGRSITSDLQFSIPSRTLVTQTFTKESISTIALSGIDKLVVDDNTFNATSVPSQRYAKVSDEDLSLSIAAGEYKLANSLPSSLSPSAQANYLIAATSIITLEAPSVSRGAIIPLDIGKLDASVATEFIRATSNNPLTRTIKLDTFFNELDEDKSISNKLKNQSIPVDKTTKIDSGQVDEVGRYARAGESIYPSSSITNNVFKWSRLAILSRSDRKVNEIISSESVRQQVENISNVINLPQKRTITLTSREDEIPVTVKNSSGEVLKVLVEVDSDKLSFPEGSRYEVTLNQENTTLVVPVKARTAGSFPISVRVLSPSQEVEIVKQGVTVRSSAFSGVGVAISIASILFLAFWWIVHSRKKANRVVAPVIDMPVEKRA